ncbi:16S rRNA (adenine(1518)-N(6)/adenine(1519)-N(6))-dimethyltransferase RsmA [Rhodohalobacter sp. 8-1]|uniref:16S rRNA (adenine(1518)-N(6)/adenine(1519)-N(6))- dimethyltransferase RsmA n=1 Tax=Rhodohalobacter sp. 8-1 TaxID=3131972 RepID=UPI0030EDE436
MADRPRKKKSLGQHFLRDYHMIQKIAGSLPADEGERVVEIGPGGGALTEVLHKNYKNFTAIEIDPVMVSHLNETLPDLHVIKQDILKTDWQELSDESEPIHVIGNLPYFITSQILFSLLESRKLLKSATLMMQKEVAERIVAEPRTKAYGILSVQTQLMSTPEILFDVPPEVFSPPPNVMSSVIQLHFNKPDLTCSDAHLKTVVRTAFNQRRKKLSNSLKPLETDLPDDEFNFDLRAEALEPAMYEKLTARLEQLGTFG